MLKKIVSLNNLGIFKEYSMPGNIPEFTKHNLIYGWNASGKTTISKLFQALATGNHSDFPDLKYKINISDSQKQINEKIPYNKSIKVFNKDYISENIEIESNKAKTIIVLGKENKEISEEIKKDTEKLIKDKDDKCSCIKSIEDKENEKNLTFTQIAKTIGTALGGNALRNYRRNNAEQKFNLIFKEETGESKILSNEKEESYLKNLNQDTKEKIDNIKNPCFLVNRENKTLEVALEIYSNEAKNLCHEVVELVSIKRLKDNIDILKWVENGLTLHRKHRSNNCEFCSQSLPKERLLELKKFFNEKDQELKTNIDILDGKFKDIQSIIEKIVLPDKTRLYDELQEQYENKKTDFEEKQNNLLQEITNFCKKLRSKKESTDNPIEIGPYPKASEFIQSVEEINSLIRKHNEKTDQFDEIISESKEKLECHYLATIYGKVQEIKEEINGLKNKKNEKDIQIKEIEERIRKNNTKISSPQIACDDINKKLEIFLGRKEISFRIEDKEYLIERHNKPAKNLSEGERTAIALIYFLTSLNEEGFNLTESIIFIDDPVSSLDSSAMTQAFAFIKSEIKDAEQIFISTHNYQFFKKVQSWIGKPNGKPNDNAKFYMIKNFMNPDKTRNAKIEKIDNLITKYNSEYQYMFSLIYNYSQNENNREMEEWYPLPNIARKFMESFLSFMVPSERFFIDQLREVFSKNSSISSTKKERIESFLNAKSHTFPEGMIGFDLDNFCEIKEVLKDILTVVENVNNEHYKQLCSIVR